MRIRIWNGCRVVHVIDLNEGSSVTSGAVGGAEMGGRTDIELDPWSGLIIDNRTSILTPVNFRQEGEF
jgi:hypothetical protein